MMLCESICVRFSRRRSLGFKVSSYPSYLLQWQHHLWTSNQLLRYQWLWVIEYAGLAHLLGDMMDRRFHKHHHEAMNSQWKPSRQRYFLLLRTRPQACGRWFMAVTAGNNHEISGSWWDVSSSGTLEDDEGRLMLRLMKLQMLTRQLRDASYFQP